MLTMEYSMPDLFLAAVTYGGYISLAKFVLFLLLFFLMLPAVTWVHQDAETVGTRKIYWTAVVFAGWAFGSVIWLLIGNFYIGLLVYLIAAGVTSISYVMHRNSRVPRFQRVLTAEHIKGLFGTETKKIKAMQKNFVFITANNNEVPVPDAKTPEFFGYKAAFDLFNDAIWRRAYDIVFTPTAENYSVLYYVDGTALKQPDIPRDRMEYFIRFAKHLADLDPAEKRKPQKGKFAIFRNKQRTAWQVATAGSTAGEQLRIKQLIQQSITKLDQLGLTANQLDQMRSLRNANQGLFIVAGPKNSGVTTSFYALLKNHDAFLNSITTVEKQVASDLPNITQNIFSLSDSGITTFAKKVQSVIRMDPDIVGIGDCADTESAQIACAAALDGKTIYLTLEADNVLKALARWIKLVANREKAVSALMGISSQRIFRMLCENCKQAYEPNKELLHKFNIPPEKAKVLYRAGKVVYDKRGKPSPCEVCQETGYVGRTGVFETILIDENLRRAILKSKSLSEVGTNFRKTKMLYLQEQMLKKIIAGTTSINEMVRVLASPKEQKPSKPAPKK